MPTIRWKEYRFEKPPIINRQEFKEYKKILAEIPDVLPLGEVNAWRETWVAHPIFVLFLGSLVLTIVSIPIVASESWKNTIVQGAGLMSIVSTVIFYIFANGEVRSGFSFLQCSKTRKAFIEKVNQLVVDSANYESFKLGYRNLNV